MLVLSRKQNETIHLGDEIVVKVVKIRGNVVGLGITAPQHVQIKRSELLTRQSREVAKSA